MLRRTLFFVAGVSLASTLMAVNIVRAEDAPRIAPLGDVLKTKGHFELGKKKEKKEDEDKEQKFRQAMSGVACSNLSAGGRRCLAAFDEGTEARLFELDDETMDPKKDRIALIAGKGELDAEGAATDGAFFYVVGSHSVKRKTCEDNPASRHVLRFKVDPGSGGPARDKSEALAGYADTGRLWEIMQSVDGLEQHVGAHMCLGTEPPEDNDTLQGKRGVNIEGLAVKDGRLFFGFRGPAIGGMAKLLAVDADALFGSGDARAKLYDIPVGAGRGVRDLLAVSDGVLVLAGPDDDKANEIVGWTVLRWSGEAESKTKALAALDLTGVKTRGCDKEIKPEALTVLADEPGAPYHAVIFSDGMCEGGALAFDIPRRDK